MNHWKAITGLSCIVMALSVTPQLAHAGGSKAASASKTTETSKKDTQTKSKSTTKSTTDSKTTSTTKSKTESTMKSTTTTKSSTTGDPGNNRFGLEHVSQFYYTGSANPPSVRGQYHEIDLSLSSIDVDCFGSSANSQTLLAIGQPATTPLVDCDASDGPDCVPEYSYGLVTVHRDPYGAATFRSAPTVTLRGDEHLDSTADETTRTAAAADPTYGQAIALHEDQLIVSSETQVELWRIHPGCTENKQLKFVLDADELYCEDFDWNANALRVDDVSFAATNQTAHAPTSVVAAISDGNAACMVAYTLDGEASSRVSLPRPLGEMRLGDTKDGVAVTLVTQCESSDGETCDDPETTLDETSFSGIPTSNSSSELEGMGQAVLDRYELQVNPLTDELSFVQESLGAEMTQRDLEACVDACHVLDINSNGAYISSGATEDECFTSCTTIDLMDSTTSEAGCDEVSNMTPRIFGPDDDEGIVLGDYGLSNSIPDLSWVAQRHQAFRSNAITEYTNLTGAQVAHPACADEGSTTFDSADLLSDRSENHGFVSLPYYGVIFGGTYDGTEWQFVLEEGNTNRFGEDMIAFDEFLIVSVPGNSSNGSETIRTYRTR